jgi:hypothetical protein
MKQQVALVGYAKHQAAAAFATLATSAAQILGLLFDESPATA